MSDPTEAPWSDPIEAPWSAVVKLLALKHEVPYETVQAILADFSEILYMHITGKVD